MNSSLAFDLCSKMQVYWAVEAHQIGKANSSMELWGELWSLDQHCRSMKRNGCTWKKAWNKSHWHGHCGSFVFWRNDRDVSFNAVWHMDSVTLCFPPSSTFCPTWKRAQSIFFKWTLCAPIVYLQLFAFEYVVFLTLCWYWVSEVHVFVFICMLRVGEAQSLCSKDGLLKTETWNIEPTVSALDIECVNVAQSGKVFVCVFYALACLLVHHTWSTLKKHMQTYWTELSSINLVYLGKVSRAWMFAMSIFIQPHTFKPVNSSAVLYQSLLRSFKGWICSSGAHVYLLKEERTSLVHCS